MKHCFQFLLGVKVAPRETENNTYAKFWGDQQVRKLIAHFTVTVGNEAGVDLVLIQPCLLYYVNHVFVILNSIF